MRIGTKEISDNHPTYIIGEIGINHNGDFDTARRLIDAAAEAKVDAVKFQKRTLSEIYPKDVLENTSRYEQSFQYLIPILKECELSDEDHVRLKEYAESAGLEYICTPFDKRSADLLHRMGVKAYKVASCDLTNFRLLGNLSRQRKPLLISTGMSTWAEIEETADMLKNHSVDFALLHCRSSYPVWPREANLKMITKLKQFGVPVGYSGHDIGTTIPLVAASMGASIIEKHITLDRYAKGPDHKISLLPDELKILVRDIRIADQCMQDSDRFLLRGEILNRDVFRYKGARTGLESPTIDLDHKPIGRWGLITRPSEIEGIERFNPRVIELHLTESDLSTDWTPKRYDSELVVHAPEYIQDKIADLCSGDGKIRNASIDVAQKTIDWTNRIAEFFTGNPKVIVHPGAMSMVTRLKPEVLKNNLRNALNGIDAGGVELLLENLPPYPVYFGGSWKGNFFMCADEIKNFCNETGLNICFDLSHAALYCNSSDGNLCDYIKTIKQFIRHMHIADAYGVTGEGVQIGKGDINFKEIIPLLDFENTTYVMEVWQGHQNGNRGFIEALNKLGDIL